MYNGKVIRKILRERNLLQKDLLEYLYSDVAKSSGSITQLENGNPTVKTLERIADYFHVSMDVFFERSDSFIQKGSASANEYELRIDSLEKLIAEKDKRIDLLEQLNQLLKKPNDFEGQNSDFKRDK